MRCCLFAEIILREEIGHNQGDLNLDKNDLLVRDSGEGYYLVIKFDSPKNIGENWNRQPTRPTPSRPIRTLDSSWWMIGIDDYLSSKKERLWNVFHLEMSIKVEPIPDFMLEFCASIQIMVVGCT